ncbi:hypothetical protein [Tengunoibacter tsumagoiensis]|uniref:Uncharacterized protein n=1 Tax=Tengunoibacter tsumagoiensis TaxID=2014871 RepID=A0A402A8A2_9CHLR|nr:hypothetical protein [Tengunoibacter tsumagoiensis]GCE15329.1 hypothetical protein KTT_51880 [Tengunoibacter tsumagoiensis]
MDEEIAPIESYDERVDLLNLAGWTILDIHENKQTYHFIAEVAQRVTTCPL